MLNIRLSSLAQLSLAWNYFIVATAMLITITAVIGQHVISLLNLLTWRWTELTLSFHAYVETDKVKYFAPKKGPKLTNIYWTCCSRSCEPQVRRKFRPISVALLGPPYLRDQ